MKASERTTLQVVTRQCDYISLLSLAVLLLAGRPSSLFLKYITFELEISENAVTFGGKKRDTFLVEGTQLGMCWFIFRAMYNIK